MFKDREDCIVLAEKVFLFKNFISQEKVNEINSILDKFVEDDNTKESPEHPINWYHGKVTPIIPELLPIWESISEMLLPEYVMQPSCVIQVMRPGQDMYVHEDSPGMDQDEDLESEDKWSACCSLEFGLVAYFGKWEGGEVYYPGIDNEFGEKPLMIKPESGDIVIHSTYYPYAHGVKEVKSGYRYAFSNFVMKKEMNPGTFYSYGTPEHKERSKDINNWVDPLWENPLFPDGKMVSKDEIKENAEKTKQQRKQFQSE